MNNFKYIILLLVMALLASCGSRRAAMGGTPIEDAAVSRVVDKHYETEVDFETLQGRLRVQFQNESQNQTVTVSYRMKKDDTIWMSAQVLGFPLAKVLITPESVKFYEKIGSTSFDGDFSLLSDVLGTPLDFEKVQNMLLGQSIYKLTEEPYKLTESARGYQLEPRKEGSLQKMFLLDAKNFKTIAQQISQKGAARSVTITYPEYQVISNQVFPRQIKIIANEGASTTQLDMEFRSVEFDVPVSFPFAIPSGFEEISIE